MSKELYWLALTAMMTGLFWAPYILNRMAEIGIFEAVFNPNLDPKPKARWAVRMVSAHNNAVENLVVFGALVIAVQFSGTATALTASAAMVYFFARLGHFVFCTVGVPGLRTVTFLVGFGCQMLLGLTAIGVI